MIFVTGATGFIGASLARLLVERGEKVRVLARKGSDRRNLTRLDVEIHEGDLTDRECLVRAIKGCATAYHVAADYRLWVPDPQKMFDANVGGTRNILGACKANGIERLVYTSTVGVLGIMDDGTPSDENTSSQVHLMTGHYKKSKFLAEELVREETSKGFPCVIVNPSAPVGAGDIKPTPTGQTILDFLNGKMPAYVETGLNIVDVDDVALGHILAMEKGRAGERYILGGENLTLSEILTILAQITGLPRPKIKLPVEVAIAAAYVSEAIAKITAKNPRIPLSGARMARKKMFFSSAKAEKELGYKHRPAREALGKAVSWFTKEGYVKKPVLR